jgi:hypothetical protein
MSAIDAGDYDLALRLLRAVTFPNLHTRVTRALVLAFAKNGDFDKATALFGRSDTAERRRILIKTFAEAVIERQDRTWMDALIVEGSDWMWHDDLLNEMVRATASSGRHDEAEALARSVDSPPRQARLLTTLAGVDGQPQPERLIARALWLDEWTVCINVIARLRPQAAHAIADALDRSDHRTANPRTHARRR